jgi:hypothetical protein
MLLSPSLRISLALYSTRRAPCPLLYVNRSAVNDDFVEEFDAGALRRGTASAEAVCCSVSQFVPTDDAHADDAANDEANHEDQPATAARVIESSLRLEESFRLPNMV